MNKKKMSRSPTSSVDPPLRFYGRRKGKPLKNARAGALETVLPQIKISLSDKIKPAALFPFPVKKIWLEIGFGNGEHLLRQAIDHPDIGFIGFEPFLNGISALCVDIKKHGVKNIRIWPDDARLLLPHILPHSVDRLFILNSDPWPKKKHHKRRFIQTETLNMIKTILKPGAELCMSTDHPSLASWLIEKTYSHPGYTWTAKGADDWRQRPKDIPETRYQQKGLKQGRPTVFLTFRV